MEESNEAAKTGARGGQCHMQKHLQPIMVNAEIVMSSVQMQKTRNLACDRHDRHIHSFLSNYAFCSIKTECGTQNQKRHPRGTRKGNSVKVPAHPMKIT